MEKLLYYFCIKLDIVTQSTIASNIASTIAENVKNIDSQLDEKITSLVSTIAENEQKVMTKALYSQDRETFFKTIGVTNQRKNYKK